VQNNIEQYFVAHVPNRVTFFVWMRLFIQLIDLFRDLGGWTGTAIQRIFFLVLTHFK